jgi:hypothetical protein
MEDTVAKEPPPKPVDVAKVKAALVSAGLLKSTTLGAADEAKIREELARNHLDKLKLGFTIICHSGHYCIIVKDLN